MVQNHVYRVRALGTLRSSRVEWGVHIRQDGATGSAQTLGAHFIANVGPLITAATSVECNWDEVIVSDTDPNGEETVRLTITQPAPGLISGDCLPGQNAVVVSLSTGTKGRRRHGRFYVPGVSETSHANGILLAPQLTAIQALANGLENFYGPSGTLTGFRLVVYSPEQLDPPKPKTFKPRPGTIITPVTDTRVDTIVRTQRRRAIGVGR